jgi:hypothetical protein
MTFRALHGTLARPDAQILAAPKRLVNRTARPLFVPKTCQEYQNISNNIELHRNAEASKNGRYKY